MSNFIIKNGNIVNEGRQIVGSLVVTDGIIEQITANDSDLDSIIYKDYETIDAKGCYVIPGIIDTHVHFREPGLTHKADIASESKAAAYGGITSYFDMPNTNPQTTTMEALREKQKLAREKSLVNWAFFPGATNDNIEILERANGPSDTTRSSRRQLDSLNELLDKLDTIGIYEENESTANVPISEYLNAAVSYPFILLVNFKIKVIGPGKSLVKTLY